jgi:murein DD-endopeptidase MepM/ murein hydrolase activator NlpD
MMGRSNVMFPPPGAEGIVLVSGHHGKCEIFGNRVIIDASGGVPSKYRPIQAFVFPDRVVVGSDNSVKRA